MASATLSNAATISMRKIPAAAAVGGAIAVAGNLVVYFIGLALGASLLVPMGGPGGPIMQVPVVAVIVATLIPTALAALLLAALARFLGARALRTFQIIAAVMLVLSFLPFTSMPLDGATIVTLGLMHVAAAAALVWAFTTRTRA